MKTRNLVMFVAGIGLIVAIVVYISFKNKQPLTSYTCENGTNFTVEFVNPKKLQIFVRGIIHTFPRETASDEKVLIFGNKKYVYTFVSGYSGQVIVTDKLGPYSTICHIESAKSTKDPISPYPLI